MGDSNIIDDAPRVRERARAASFDFLMQELELGLTFCRIAQADHSTELAGKHRAEADKAYQTVLHHVAALSLTDEEHKLFDQKAEDLRQLLEQLDSENR